MRTPLCILTILTITLAGISCRSAVVVAPKDPNTQTIITVEHRPTTNPADKGLVIQEK